MDEPADPFLRTFGAVPTSNRVLDPGCGVHADPLVTIDEAV